MAGFFYLFEKKKKKKGGKPDFVVSIPSIFSRFSRFSQFSGRPQPVLPESFFRSCKTAGFFFLRLCLGHGTDCSPQTDVSKSTPMMAKLSARRSQQIHDYPLISFSRLSTRRVEKVPNPKSLHQKRKERKKILAPSENEK